MHINRKRGSRVMWVRFALNFFLVRALFILSGFAVISFPMRLPK
ncbi:hypothetical protein OKW33_006189 [Paraburkholderia atlantica]|uniref:Uncharacterized protein n=1 Tax=Paraburkholderia atlantica TaxID=2654982 RepID=A0A7W8QEJ1_PARAM|nr:hypothetical protein [Paraburkholderia atlantica]MBB5428957.1 hypothetical protein [Paraburkholderia atlantica]